jgi:hypothetical protein
MIGAHLGEQLTRQPNEPEADSGAGMRNVERPTGARGRSGRKKHPTILEHNLHHLWLGGLANWEVNL